MDGTRVEGNASNAPGKAKPANRKKSSMNGQSPLNVLGQYRQKSASRVVKKPRFLEDFHC